MPKKKSVNALPAPDRLIKLVQMQLEDFSIDQLDQLSDMVEFELWDREGNKLLMDDEDDSQLEDFDPSEYIKDKESDDYH